jgi:hypothetical protein
MNPSASANAVFSVTLASNMQIGSLFPLTITTTAGGYSANHTFNLTAGDILETFETGNLAQYPWVSTGSMPWTVTSSGSFQGTYCARSGIIGNNEASELKITINVMANDTISFYSMVSSEQDYDYLHFYIDATEMASWSGVVNWGYHAYPITAGTHVLRWLYDKDVYLASNLDLARVDNINFPPFDFPAGISPVVSSAGGLNVYPNPASGMSTISFTLEKTESVSLTIYNSIGQEVSTLLNNAEVEQGIHHVTISSGELGKGIYFIRLNAGSYSETTKFVVE